ncbi:MAG: cysteine--tRNA ligase [Dehalococcoidia bacterium]|nr:MAG: cysteine--tRNA ligase [Dehalococcoidia bacterium]
MKVYNTRSGRKEDFAPGDPVRMYVCGVTPYSECHIGHAMSYIVFDVIRRYLEFRGYRVRHVQNFTDVDDKIIARSSQLGISAKELAEGFISQYFADMDALNIKRADIYPRATEEIPKIIEVIDGLIQKGHAYHAGGDVYFRVASFPQYGKLSHRATDEMFSTEEATGKEQPMDFALWKAAKPGEPYWESPWGLGRPGWHIECSAMSLKYLGETLDIHGGGQDLIFPHHENEIAQSEAFTEVTPFVRYWLHNGLMQLGEEKMSKSLGNLITVKEALDRYSADALRLFVLSSHYRSSLTYTEEGLAAMERGAERLRFAAHRQGGDGPTAIEVENYRQRFMEAMDDDFNTAQAIAALFDLAREINRAAEEGHSIREGQKALLELAGVLGLQLVPPQYIIEIDTYTVESKLRELSEHIREELIAAGQGGLIHELDGVESLLMKDIIDRLLALRSGLRAKKQWALADKIRAQLAKLRIILEDTPQGTNWRYRR